MSDLPTFYPLPLFPERRGRPGRAQLAGKTMIRLFKHYIPHAVILLWFIDLLLLVIAGEVAWRLRASQIGIDIGGMENRIWSLAGFAFVTSIAMISVGVYGNDALRSLRYAWTRMLVAISLAAIALAFVDFLIATGNFLRSTLAYELLIALCLLMANRHLLGALRGGSAFRRRMLSSGLKRVFETVASALLMVVSVPIIAVLVLLGKSDSKGSAFFRQTCVGLYRQGFGLIKLRSMRIDAEADGAKWTSTNNPRVARLGRLIRKVRIDALPQAWSVLKAEMSFVAPRPERPEFLADCEDQFPYYAKSYKPLLDLLIIPQTLRVVLWREGAR